MKEQEKSKKATAQKFIKEGLPVQRRQNLMHSPSKGGRELKHLKSKLFLTKSRQSVLNGGVITRGKPKLVNFNRKTPKSRVFF
jgi:hypothetical protein